MVSDAIKSASYSDITVRINSPGGDAFEGVSIHNVLRSAGKPVNVVVDGLAASAASIVAMAGDTRVMNTGSVMMIHEAMALAMGNAADMTKMAETLTTVTGAIADIYVSRTGLPKDEVLAMQTMETWMSADEALAKGFATATGSAPAVKNSYDLTKFRNAPVELGPVAEEPVKEQAIEDDEPVADAEPDALQFHARQFEVNKRK
jgi:ATP-dependent protease ClpP protease subunit